MQRQIHYHHIKLNYIRTHQSLPKNTNSLTNEQIDEYIKSHSNPRDNKSPKLIANLNNKEQYVLHMKNLKTYLLKKSYSYKM